VIAAAASSGVADLLDGPLRRGHLLGSSGHVAWVEFDGRVVVIGDPDSVRLPNGIVTTEAITPLLVPSDPEISIGRGGIIVGRQHAIRVLRRWDPRPVLPAVNRLVTLGIIRNAAGDVEAMGDSGLGGALASRNSARVVGSASRLMGRGPGLTPEGDDLLAAALASYLLMSESLRREAAIRLVASVSGLLMERSERRTTALASSLLAHALTGGVVVPIADLLRAICGRGEVSAALETLCTVGHSSGPAYAAGVFAGAAAACLGTR
jgi:hypothetical protein